MHTIHARLSQSVIKICAIVILGPLLLPSAATAQPNPDAKIEPRLLQTLSDNPDGPTPFFLVFEEQPDLSAAHAMNNKAARGRFVGQSLVDTAQRSQAGVRGYLTGHKVSFTPFWVENKIHILEGTLDLARDLARRPDVAAIVAEEIFTVPEPDGKSGPTTTTVQWNIAKIRANQAWSITKGAGVVVANIDTGVQYNHPALVAQYRGNTGSTFTHTGNWFDATGTYPAAPADDNGHGTHTMGIMVGDDLKGNQIGVAPQAQWIACRACSGSSGCFASALTACAQWIMDPYGNGSFSGQPDVVNNSWSGGSGDTWFQSYIQNWRAAGIFPAFSTGNTGPSCNTAASPGDDPASVAAGATDGSDVVASFSSRGPSKLGPIKPDLTAPGVSVRSSVPGNGFGTYSGTSQAAPHIAGTVALVWAAAPAYNGNIAATLQLLRDKAVRITTLENCGGTASLVPNDTYGYGRIDALASVQAVAKVITNTAPVVTVTSPSSGASVNCGTPVLLTGTAKDAEDGDLSAMLKWTSGGSSLGTGASVSPTFACTNTTSTLTTLSAAATDPKGLTGSASLTINVVNPSIVPAPTSLAGTVSSTKFVNLTWKWSGSMTLQGFRVERKGNAKTATWIQVGSLVPANARSSSDSPGTGSWNYRVFAVGNSSTSPASNQITVRVQ
jgi:subtilisin family serine protease